jgi:hypothetical protein
MTFKHSWHKQEANFGAPIVDEVHGGAHVSVEILPSFQGKYLLCRRPNGVPGHVLPPNADRFPRGLLYFCYDLIRWGESTEQCISRIVKEQIEAAVVSYRVVDFYSYVHADSNNWAMVPCFIAELAALPKISATVTEVVQCDTSSLPDDIAWWGKPDILKLMA